MNSITGLLPDFQLHFRDAFLRNTFQYLLLISTDLIKNLFVASATCRSRDFEISSCCQYDLFILFWWVRSWITCGSEIEKLVTNMNLFSSCCHEAICALQEKVMTNIKLFSSFCHEATYPKAIHSREREIGE